MSGLDLHHERMPRRRSTAVSYQCAVEKVVARIRERPGEPLDLAAMAACAAVSRSHFDRVFRNVTGLSPRHFQTAVRLRAATRLILTTDLSITDICYDVGYESLGSFVTRFTQSFGISPMRLRNAIPDLQRPLRALLGGEEHLPAPPPPPAADAACRAGVRGAVSGFEGLAFIGLFTERIADHAPQHCAIAAGAGPFAIDDAADGCYWVLAIAMQPDRRAIDVLLDDDIPRAALPAPVRVTGEAAERELLLEFRPPSAVDPPVNLVLPLLMRVHDRRIAAERAESDRNA